jgi:alkylation response protein AidB-like acyl-CoA dehydrogenase
MKLQLTLEEQQFLAEAREFLKLALLEDISNKVLKGLPPGRDENVRWQKALHEKGWATPNWPTEYGGTGWSTVQHHVWDTECARAGAPQVRQRPGEESCIS